ncbi:type I restriction enzyme HsdR N-terminal domain-containing protein [Daejeonella lutea]|uniref:Type I restriction enzyme R protein N terminus (HSDR_N) n=1 Tax=Daejeonella lutea TaxID=572036 RepID=A0A1T5A423_9SPHI|nr:type I restriction enzyme HsdR N-terminal domain-containing protein [Daejeonella lutea]SKB29393.1 Type I restriction enzyme R protein N terminus (HSDR_N) [Daejeonella lutea]
MFEPTSLNLPHYPFRLKQTGETMYIFDEVRKKFLVLTPEEWVRQHFVQFLINEKKYPRSLIKLEGGLTLNTLKKRSDILLFNNLGEKTILIECKAPSVKISQSTFDQVARYNFVHRVKFLVVTNGLQHYCAEINFENESYQFLKNLPEYSSADRI